MKRYISIIFAVVVSAFSFGQDELVNTFVYKSTMHGGTEMSGTSTSLACTFVANKDIEMINILFENEPLLLEKRDTLIIYFISHKPYNQSYYADAPQKYVSKKSFSCYYRNGAYHVSVNREEEFQRAATYRYGRKNLTAERKETIDSAEEHFAP